MICKQLNEQTVHKNQAIEIRKETNIQTDEQKNIYRDRYMDWQISREKISSINTQLLIVKTIEVKDGLKTIADIWYLIY